MQSPPTPAVSPVEDHGRSNTPQPPHAAFICPHCRGVLDLNIPFPLPAVVSSERRAAESSAAPPTSGLARKLDKMLARAFPIARELQRPATAVPTSSPSPIRMAARYRWIIPLLVPLFGLLFWLIGNWFTNGLGQNSQAGATLAAAPMTAMPVASTTTITTSLDPDRANVLAIVAAYNAADPQIAATLTLDAIRPYVDEEGPLWERRSREMAMRKETQATHATRLLRWAIGAITIDKDGSRATITTQETWEDQAGTIRHAWPRSASCTFCDGPMHKLPGGCLISPDRALNSVQYDNRCHTPMVSSVRGCDDLPRLP